MTEIEPSTQKEMYEWYDEHAAQAATVGDYVRVVVNTTDKKSCFGPMGGDAPEGWQVVEIDWENGHFLLAPVEQRSLDE